MTAQKANQQAKLFVYNLSFGALIGGAGAAINKSHEEHWTTAFLRGFWQGSIGGSLNFVGRKTIYLVNKKERLIYAWPAKLINDAGTSIIENAARNQPFLKKWNMNVGPLRFDISLEQSVSVKVRILPVSVYSIIAGFQAGNLDLRTTVLTGNVAFKTSSTSLNVSGIASSGASFGRAFAYVDDSAKCHYIAHEIIHQFQFDQYQSINSLLKSVVSERIRESKVAKIVYPDVPYFWLFYALGGQHGLPSYYRNFYELEAESFSTNRFVRTK